MREAQPMDDEGIRSIMAALGIRGGIEWPLVERLVARIRQEQARVAITRELLTDLADTADHLAHQGYDWMRLGGEAHALLANPDPDATRLLAEARLGRAYAAWDGENGTETALALTDAHGALIALTQAQEAANV